MADTSNSVLFDQPGPKGRRTIRIVNWVAALIFVGVLVLILMRLHNPPDGENQLSWELWKPALEREAWTDFYLPGLWMTVKASIVAVVGSVVFGLVFGVGRLLPNVVLRAISSVVVEFCRAVPVLLLMIFFWRWFAFAGLSSPSYWAVVLALVLYNGSVVAELVRSGVGNLPNGQREASLALGLTETQSLMQIEVPQAVYAMLPGRRHAAGRGAQGYRAWIDHHVHRSAAGVAPSRLDVLQHPADAGRGRGRVLHRLLAAVASGRMAAVAHAAAHRAPAEPEPVPPIAIMDPSNVNQIAVAKEVEERPCAHAAHIHAHHAAATPRSTTGSARATSRASTRPIPIRRAEMRRCRAEER